MKDFHKTYTVPVTRYDSWWNPSSFNMTNIIKSQTTYQSENSRRIDGKLQLTPHPFHREWVSWSSTIGFYTQYGGGREPLVATRLGWNDIQSTEKDAQDACTRKFYSEVGGIKANLADIYRTRRETANMIVRRLSQLTRAALAVRRGDWRKASRALGMQYYKPKSKRRQFSSDWLEYQYGWAPLVSDIYHIAEGFPDIKTSIRVTGYGRNDFDIWQNGKTIYNSYWNHWVGYSQSRCVIEGDVHFHDSAVKPAADWGLTNPAAVAWEAVPWSFVVDWFIPIGDYLESLTALSGLSFTRLNITFTTTQTSAIEIGFNRLYGFGESPSGVEVIKRKKRYLIGSPPSYPLPSFKNPVSVIHSLNALALLRTALKGK